MDARQRVEGPHVRLGVIGTGGMGQGHCSRMNTIPEVRRTAVCDIVPEVAKNVGEQYQVP